MATASETLLLEAQLMDIKIKRECAKCRIAVTPANWIRLASGYLLCGKCYWMARAVRTKDAMSRFIP